MRAILLSLDLDGSRNRTRLIKTVYFDEVLMNLIQIKKTAEMP
jgi:hypothetical protein